MTYISLMQRIKELESQIVVILSNQDLDVLHREERQLVIQLKHTATDARLSVRDYEYADTRQEQLKHATEAHQYIDKLRQQIVKTSEYGVFGAVDVAQLTAQVESIKQEIA